MSNGVIDDIGKQLGSIGSQIKQGIADAPKAAVRTVASQVGIELKDETGKKEIPQVDQKPQELDQKAKAENADFVKQLYGVDTNKKQEEARNPQVAAASKLAKENPQKSPEEIQKM